MNYPEINDPDFYKKIYLKKEFNIHKFDSDNKRNASGLLNHQAFLKNFINPDTPYDKLLVMHKTGTGKTLTAISIAENYYRRFEKINKKIYFIGSTAAILSFKNELLSNKTDIFYNKKNIKSLYYTYTYDTLLLKLQNNRINDFSNALIIFDEVHNMSDNLYVKFINTLNASINTTIITMSATPMIDHPTQIIKILNILSHKSQRIPISNIFSDKYFTEKNGIQIITDKGIKLVQTLGRGKVSFLDIDDTTFPKIIEKGNPLNTKNSLKIIKCKFDKEHQLQYFLKIFKNDSGYYHKSSRAAFLVYPDGSSGKGDKKANTAFYKYFKKIKVPKTTNISHFKPKIDNDFLKLENLGKYSCKLKELLININKANGPIFIYNYFKEGGSYIIAAMLEANGFSNIYNVDSSKDKTKKFAILSGEDTNENKKNDILNRFNNIDNKNGNKLKIIIGTRVLSEGVTLLRTSQVHILEPEWNRSILEQVIGRAVRHNSHKDGIIVPAYNKPVVEIYKYSSYFGDEGYIDYKKYNITQNKDYYIKQIERILKELAVDCLLNRHINIKQGQDNSRECDYKNCDYKCAGTDSSTATSKLNKTTYFTKFGKKNINFAINLIIELYKTHFTYTEQQFFEILRPYKLSKQDISSAINKIIKNKIALTDKFNRKGYLLYRQFNNKYYYIFNENDSNPSTSNYLRTKGSLKKVKGNISEFINSKNIKVKSKSRSKSKSKSPPVSVASSSKAQAPKRDDKAIINKFNILSKKARTEYFFFGSMYSVQTLKSGIQKLPIKQVDGFKIVTVTNNNGTPHHNNPEKGQTGKICGSFTASTLKKYCDLYGFYVPEGIGKNKKQLCYILKEGLRKKKMLLE